MRHFPTIAAIGLLALAPGARADEVTDALQNAIEAYQEGDIGYALEEMAYAEGLMLAIKAEGLAAFLPEPPAGWTREIDANAGAAMGMLGGGSAAGATYSGDGESFSITFTADSPMVTAMAGMFGNAAMLSATGGSLVRVGREKFADQNGELTGLIDNRVLIQASGAPVAVMVPILETIDFRELARFGS